MTLSPEVLLRTMKEEKLLIWQNLQIFILMIITLSRYLMWLLSFSVLSYLFNWLWILWILKRMYWNTLFVLHGLFPLCSILYMILRLKPGKIAGLICLVVYVATQILETVLSTVNSYVVFRTLAVAIPVFIMMVYFAVPDKILSRTE